MLAQQSLPPGSDHTWAAEGSLPCSSWGGKSQEDGDRGIWEKPICLPGTDILQSTAKGMCTAMGVGTKGRGYPKPPELFGESSE